MLRDVTVVIPSIPPRAHLLHRAIGSVLRQTHPATALSVVVDHDHEGAAVIRDRALDAVRTTWVAFLDDDDEMLPEHLAALLDHAEATGADYVYPWYTVIGGVDPMPGHFGRPWDPADPRQTTITTLVRTDLAQNVGFLRPSEGDSVGGQVWGEDYQFTLGCARAGARIEHLPQRTWLWYHNSGNTSGRPDRW